jgi:hypothetical protein
MLGIAIEVDGTAVFDLGDNAAGVRTIVGAGTVDLGRRHEISSLEQLTLLRKVT